MSLPSFCRPLMLSEATLKPGLFFHVMFPGPWQGEFICSGGSTSSSEFEKTSLLLSLLLSSVEMSLGVSSSPTQMGMCCSRPSLCQEKQHPRPWANHGRGFRLLVLGWPTPRDHTQSRYFLVERERSRHPHRALPVPLPHPSPDTQVCRDSWRLVFQ